MSPAEIEKTKKQRDKLLALVEEIRSYAVERSNIPGTLREREAWLTTRENIDKRLARILK